MNQSLYGSDGFVYVLKNPSFPGLLKVGVTRLHPLQRIQQLSAASGVPTPFELAYFRDFNDVFKAESVIHNLLATYRVNESREFFRLSVEEVVRIIDKASLNLRSRGIVGGKVTQSEVATPFADLFHSFAPSDSPYLNPDERRQCRELEQRQNGAQISYCQ